MQIADGLSRLGEETAFEVRAKANALEAQGIDVVHMELGEPDFDPPRHVRDAAVDAIQKGLTQYTPSKGLPEVREVFAHCFSKLHQIPLTRTEVVIAPGEKPILYFGLVAILNKGDEVIYPEPASPIYKSVIEYFGGKAVPLPLREELDFRFEHEDLWRLANDKTKVIILNSPSNPTGSVLTEHDMVVISEVAKEYDCWIISDEKYSGFLYDGRTQKSIITQPGMEDRTIVISGMSKTYAMSGWRLGFGIMPAGMANHMTRLLNNSVTCTSKLSQIAGLAALEGPQDYVEKMREEFEDRRDFIVQGLNSIENVICRKPCGAFYVFPNVREFGWTSRDIEMYLLQKANVATLAGSSFGRLGEGYVRLSYTTGKEEIEKAIEQMDQALRNLTKLETYRKPAYSS